MKEEKEKSSSTIIYVKGLGGKSWYIMMIKLWKWKVKVKVKEEDDDEDEDEDKDDKIF